MRSASQHDFSITPNVTIPRSSFRRPQTYKSTMDAGLLYPVYCEEAVPGDTLNMRSATVFSRLMTLVTPVMDNIYLDLHAWFVPMRLVWDNWEKLCGARDDPVDDYNDDTIYTVPWYFTQTEDPDAEGYDDTGFNQGTLADYFGLPPMRGFVRVSLLPFRCYNLIWNTWYRDENLQDRAFATRSDAAIYSRADLEEKYPLRFRGKRKDAFTGALPWPQKGPSVQIYGDRIPIVPLEDEPCVPRFVQVDDGTPGVADLCRTTANGTLNVNSSDLSNKKPLAWAGTVDNSGMPYSGLFADLSQGIGVTINQMREAFQLQKMFERDALGGTRYNETILAHFGVHTADARLQRPEFLGGCTIPIKVHTVVQNGATSDVTPQGNLAGFGTAGGQLSFIKSFTEFGYVIILASYRADLTYQQGIDKMWLKVTREQFYWPVFAHLGEDFIWACELFASGVASEEADFAVFGYQERYYEYRYSRNKITGLLRSSTSSYPGLIWASLDSWHLAQAFESTPKLNEEFIIEQPPLDRVLAVPSEPAFLFDALFDAVWVRPMPMYSVPGLIDHF